MEEDKTSKKRLEEELEQAHRKIALLEEAAIEHERLQKAFREFEEIYRMHFSHAKDVIYFYDDQFRIQGISPNIEKVLGYKPEELIGRPFQELGLLHPDDLDRAARDAINILSGEPLIYSTYRFFTKDGTTIYGEASGVPFYRDGRISGVISVAREITERMKSEEALRVSEEKYRLVVENSREAIFLVQDGKIRFANRKTSELSGYSLEKFNSSPVSAFVHPEDMNMVWENHCGRIFSGKLPGAHCFRVFDPEGNIRWAEANSVSVVWEGRPATLAFLLDVTEQKRVEEEKERLENDLIQAHKMDALGRFAGGIAHDLNNLLYPIIIDSEVLLEEMEPGTRMHETMKQVLTAAYRQRDLVRHILSFSRQKEQKFIPVKMPDLVRETLNFVRAMLPSTIEIRHRFDALSDTILGDPTQIQQIVMNLVRNAADSLESRRGTVEIILDNTYLEPTSPRLELKAGNYLTLAVKDTGCGMSTDVMDRIFEPFFTTKEIGRGTGVGLSVVLGSLKSHSGTITVESEPGKGSVFTVFLPVCHERDLAEEPCAEDDIPLEGKGTILLVDDEELILSSVQRVLEEAGFCITAVKDAMEALDVFSRNPHEFVLVITDLTMPGMTGTDLAKKLLAMRSDIPVILSTGYYDIIDEQEMKAMGIQEMILKPSNTVELKRAVHRVLKICCPNRDSSTLYY